jgi:hypothetical protein
MILGGFTDDDWMRILHEKLINTDPPTLENPSPMISITKGDFKKFEAIFDDKKVR